MITLRVKHFNECFKLKNSKLNTSAINAITKSSTKPWSGATPNHHLCGSGAMVRVSGWRKCTSRDEVTLNSEEMEPIAVVVIELRLSEGIR